MLDVRKALIIVIRIFFTVLIIFVGIQLNIEYDWFDDIVDYFRHYIVLKKQNGAKMNFKQAKTLIEKMPEKFSINVWAMEFEEVAEYHTKRVPINFSFIDWNLLLLYERVEEKKRIALHRKQMQKENTEEIINCIQKAQKELRSQIEKTEEENQKIADSVLQKSNAITDNWKW